MTMFLMIVALIAADGQGSLYAAQFASKAECLKQVATVVKKAKQTGAVAYAVECTPVHSIKGA